MQTQRKRKRCSGLQGADNADELMFRLTASSGDQQSHRGLGLAVRCGEVVTNPGLTHPFTMHCLPLRKPPSITKGKADGLDQGHNLHLPANYHRIDRAQGKKITLYVALSW